MSPNLATLSPELHLAIAEHLPLSALYNLVCANRHFYHLLLRSLYQRVLATFKIPPYSGGFGWWHISRPRDPWMDTARRLTLCLAAGMDKNMIISQHGETRLHIATNGLKDPREREIFQLLLLHGAEVNVKDSYGFTPLHNVLESQVGQSSDTLLEPLRMLLEHGAEVDAVTTRGYTPLFWPLLSGKHVIVGILLEHGADPNKAYPRGQTPLLLPLERIEDILHPRSVLFSTLVSLDRGETPKPDKPKDAVEVLRFLLQRGAIVEMPREPWKEALLLKGLLACVRLLVRAGALVERLETPKRKELVEFICESSAGFWDKTG